MKRVILGLLMISLVGAAVGVGTWTIFSDVETSPGNILTAGTMDLKVDGYDDPVPAYFEVDCMAPGDAGAVEISLTNEGCVDGIADLHIVNCVSNDNGVTEPESQVDTTEGPGEGELCDWLWIR